MCCRPARKRVAWCIALAPFLQNNKGRPSRSGRARARFSRAGASGQDRNGQPPMGDGSSSKSVPLPREGLTAHLSHLQYDLPTCSPESSRLWCVGGLLQRKMLSITGLRRPASTCGQTLCANSSAISDLNSTERGRSVDPVRTRRRTINVHIETSAFAPRSTEIETCRPSSARQARLRGT